MLGEKKLSISICKWLPRSVSNHGWGDQTRSNDLTSLLFREILGFLVLWENILVPVKVKEIIRKISRASDDKQHSFTLDLKWNLWLVEGIQPIYHSLWIRSWNDNPLHICSRYRVRSLLSPRPCRVLKLCKLKKYICFFCRISWIIKLWVCVICLSLHFRQTTQTSVLTIPDIALNLFQSLPITSFRTSS